LKVTIIHTVRCVSVGMMNYVKILCSKINKIKSQIDCYVLLSVTFCRFSLDDRSFGVQYWDKFRQRKDIE